MSIDFLFQSLKNSQLFAKEKYGMIKPQEGKGGKLEEPSKQASKDMGRLQLLGMAIHVAGMRMPINACAMEAKMEKR